MLQAIGLMKRGGSREVCLDSARQQLTEEKVFLCYMAIAGGEIIGGPEALFEKSASLKKRSRRSGITDHCLSAAETAQLAQKLPDRAAIKITVRVAIDEKHLANLLFWICLAKTRGL